MTELILVSAADEAALCAEMQRILRFVDHVTDVSLADVAYTCSRCRGPCVLAIVAADVPDLRARLSVALARLGDGAPRRLRDKGGTYYFRDHLLGDGGGKLAFVYPGVMSFYPNMLRDLLLSVPECRAAFDELEEAMSDFPEFTPSAYVYPPAACYRHDADVYRSGAYAQSLVATYSAGVALTRLLKSFGVLPDGVVGFAGGDLAAMMSSGAAGADPARPDRVRVIREIYRIVDKAVNHGGLPEVTMVTVLLRRPEEIEAFRNAFPPEKVTLAVDFSPRQKTFAVAKDVEAEVFAALSAAGIRAMRLKLDRPFNTALCQSLVPVVRKFVASWMRHDPIHDVYSCARAERLPAGLKIARDDTAGRWAVPVRFEETVRRMYADGYRVFLEVGPRGLMTSAVADTLRGEEHAAIALDSIHRNSRLQVLHALAQLAALGHPVDLSDAYANRNLRVLDFDSEISPEVRKNAEYVLSRAFPRLSLLGTDALPTDASSMVSATGRGARARARQAALDQQMRRQRQFDFGSLNPLVSDADVLQSSPSVLREVFKCFKLADLPFVADFALGTSQMSYSDPNLKGLVPLPVPVGIEIMAEVAQQVFPSRPCVRIEDVYYRRMVFFSRNELRLFIRAETVAAPQGLVAARVQIRDDSPNSAYTWPVMEAVVVFGARVAEPPPLTVDAIDKPRSVHWSGRDIYPARLCCGRRLRGVNFVEAWCESGIDYEVVVPPQSGNVMFTVFPMWVVNPVLLGAIVSGFPLWRSHERFAGAFSFPFRLRRLDLSGFLPAEGSVLKCYLRLTSVTPKTHICDIHVSDGNGKRLMMLGSWEELTERVPIEYCQLVLQPATTFVSEPLAKDMMGNPPMDVAAAVISDVPYSLFERNDELWLKTLSHIVLGANERREFQDMTGSASRRTEWLFGRLVAKEAVRRFCKSYYQARWSEADVRIWTDDLGKPHALGGWADSLTAKIDIAIAHTAKLIVAVAAANARVGVDVELMERPVSDEFARGVFNPDEIDLSARAVSPSKALIRFWCAKEAVSKALGTGIRYSPRDLAVVAYEPDLGRVVVRLNGAWREAFKKFAGQDVTVTVKPMRDHALAFCFIPLTLFDDE